MFLYRNWLTQIQGRQIGSPRALHLTFIIATAILSTAMISPLAYNYIVEKSTNRKCEAHAQRGAFSVAERSMKRQQSEKVGAWAWRLLINQL